MRVRFDDLVFDAEARALSQGGEEVRLPPKAFQLLELLINRAPKAVSQEVIYDALWPDTVVNIANLHNLILQLRRALGEQSRSRIRTVYGFGFSFAGDMEDAAGTAARRSEFLLLVSVEGGIAVPQELYEGLNLIGRDKRAGIRLLLPSISRRHATIHVDGSNVILEDLSSKNGTYVEGIRVERSVPIVPGCTIWFGQVTSRFVQSDSDESTLTVDLLCPRD